MSKSSHAIRGTFAVNRKLQLALAVALILAAVGLVITMSRPAATVEYLVATRDLPSGSALSPAAFVSVPMSLGTSGKNYLRELPPSATLSGPLRAGDLLEQSAIGASTSRFSIVLSPSQPVAAGIRVGSRVDVWYVAKSAGLDAAAAPVRVATGLEVRSIASLEQGLSAGANGLSKLEVAAQESELPGLILASSSSGFISVIGAN